MQHLHFESCHSTQKYLQDLLKDNDSNDFLVSCDFQDSGVGQKDKKWDCLNNTLCLSFNTNPNLVLNLTSLEIGIIICDFFKKELNTPLFLKWPNDILNSNGEKVGGIIINKSGDSRPIIGIGLNISSTENEKINEYEIKAGFIFKHYDFIKKTLAESIYNFINQNRLSPQSVRTGWVESCIHINRNVSILEADNISSGLFVGIGEYGQAQLEIDKKIQEFYTGTLRFIDPV